MNPTLTLFAALTFVTSTHAQPTLTFATNAPVIGTAYTIHYGPYVAPGNAGAAQAWDLSGLSSDSTDALQLVAPSSTTNGGQFPNATVAEVSSPVTTYYQVTAEGIRFAGSDDGTSRIVNAPLGKYLTFPCTMGSTWTTPQAAAFNYDGNDVFRTGNVSGEADGYGTLTMPWGTVQNVLRIHLVNALRDSLELFNLDYTYDSYLYYVPGQSYPIAELVTATIDFGVGMPQVEQFSRWTGPVSTGVTDPSIADSDLRIHPNPVSDVVNIDVPAGMGSNPSASIVDAAGRLVRQEQLRVINASMARLDLSELPPGVYTLMLTDGQGRRVAARLLRR